MLGPLLSGALDLLAPPHCPGCDLPTAEAHAFCAGCAPLIEKADGGLEALGGYVFGGPLADAIRRFKYGGRSELARPLVPLLVNALRPLAGRYDAIAFVPLHPRRLRARGFDQAGLLGHGAARALGVPVVHALRRLRATDVQASLDRERRGSNVRGAFAVKGKVEGARLLLIDDVRTTGATLAEASRALSSAGAQVISFALAVAEAGTDDLADGG